MKHALALALLLLLAAPCWAQHAVTREQWQPQTEDDPRLEQPVTTEIVGRATRTGLPLLSAQTGVSLSVAPEDLATVGERKFLLLAQGCTLKTVMVQLCVALQECHWDMDASGAQPAYLLHRNGGVTYTPHPHVIGGAAEERDDRADTLARLEEVRRALASPPSPELEQSDLPLALAVRSPITRGLIQAFQALPQAQFNRLLADGELTMPWDEAPAQLRQAALQALELRYAPYLRARETGGRWEGSHTTEEFEFLRARKGEPADLPLTFSNRYADANGVVLRVGGFEFVILPGRFLSGNDLRNMIDNNGVPGEVPQSALDAWDQRVEEMGAARRQARLRQQWVDPGAPELQRTIALGGLHWLRRSDLQQRVARETGLSVVSDYFVSDDVTVDQEMAEGMPAWRLLYAAGGPGSEACIREFRWRLVGQCLVFTRLDWAQAAAFDPPESLLAKYRQVLQERGRLTLDDVAAFAQELNPHPDYYDSYPMPDDLEKGGAQAVEGGGLPVLVFYASLTPDQRARARSERGLPYSAMTKAQHRELGRLAAERFGRDWSGTGRPAATFTIRPVPAGPLHAHLELRLHYAAEPEAEFVARYFPPTEPPVAPASPGQ